VTLYLEPGVLARWCRYGSPLPLGISQHQGWTWDIAAVDLANEEARTWTRDALWDGSYAKILFDPSGRVRALLAAKLVPPSPMDAGGLLFECWWHYRLAGDIWIQRGDALQGHHIFNRAVAALVGALFVANGEFVPHDKWLLHMSRTLAWSPPGWEARLAAALSTGAMDVASLRVRQAAIDALWAEIDAFARAQVQPASPVPMMQHAFYHLLHTLVTRESIPWAEWEALGGAAVMNMDPFHPLLRIEADGVRLDRERFLALAPGAMYAWHYAVLDAVRAALRPE
jgi:hypothetical protein